MKKYIVLLCILFSITACGGKKVYVPQKSSTISNIPTVPIDKDIRVALVLSGGGARAIAHLGVLEVLEENKIPVDLIIATSGGSIVGALYADNPNAIALKSIVRKMDIKDFVDFSILSNANMHSLTSSFADGSNGEKFLLKNMRAKDFKDLKMPFIAVATDIESGQTIGINNGPVAPAVRASYSIPGLFPPVQIFGMTLVDGGVTAPLGVDIAKKSNAKMIIAVDVTLPVEEHLPTNVVGLVLRSLSLNYHVLNDLLGKQSDILIKPQIRRIGMFDAHKKDELFELGRQAALKKLPEIKKHLLKKRSLIKKLLLQKTI